MRKGDVLQPLEDRKVGVHLRAEVDELARQMQDQALGVPPHDAAILAWK